MKRHAALLLCLGVAACTAPRGPDSLGDPDDLDEEIAEVAQAVEPLDAPSEENAIRFLEQATFGPRLANGATPPIDSVEKVVSVGITQSITSQLSATSVAFDGSPTSQNLDAQFFVQAIDGKDQLRQRVAFALSQIIVVSLNGLPSPTKKAPEVTPEEWKPKLAMAAYLNVLRTNAFGNYKSLLKAVTKSAAMGRYLDMVNSRAFDTASKPIEPNENFARELLQLFSLGLHQLNEDGTQKLDCPDGTGAYDGVADAACTAAAGGRPIPAYTEDHVQAFARSFSGWTYAKVGGTGLPADDCPTIGKSNPLNYGAEMIPCDANHDKSQQTLLRGGKTSTNGSATTHLDQAINNIFADPNLPPFVCKQLIQHLVTSNPSPAYVQRVVDKFKDDGAGVRGNLKVVVRAILEDNDARGKQPVPSQLATFGHLRSPVLHLTNVVRWLGGHMDLTNGKNPGAKLASASASMGQSVTRPPSVFSFYPPGAPLPGDGSLLAPEFAIYNAATSTTRANVTYDLLFTASYTNAGVTLDFGVLPTDPDELVIWLGQYPMHGSMSSDLQVTIYDAISEPWSSTASRKQKLGTMLAVLSPEFSIQR